MEDLIKPNNGGGIHNVENKTEYVGEDVGISTLSNANTEDCQFYVSVTGVSCQSVPLLLEDEIQSDNRRHRWTAVTGWNLS